MLQHLRENVYREGECLRWAGSYTTCGYPLIKWNGKRKIARRVLMGLLAGGGISDRHVVYDKCGNRWCMNEEHLRVGTVQAAFTVAAKRGKFMSGKIRQITTSVARARNARLPVTERHNLTRMLGEGMRHGEIAAHYGVSRSAVGSAIARWKRIFNSI
jgi:hypothetical protein